MIKIHINVEVKCLEKKPYNPTYKYPRLNNRNFGSVAPFL